MLKVITVTVYIKCLKNILKTNRLVSFTPTVTFSSSENDK